VSLTSVAHDKNYPTSLFFRRLALFLLLMAPLLGTPKCLDSWKIIDIGT